MSTFGLRVKDVLGNTMLDSSEGDGWGVLLSVFCNTNGIHPIPYASVCEELYIIRYHVSMPNSVDTSLREVTIQGTDLHIGDSGGTKPGNLLVLVMGRGGRT